ncbi:M20 aminoacylase family protein [Glaciimonas soli]|uniref:Amidohydrolase n=1 Tax=Glaciimonas soli TaxID=2590999 RepID=A0A843YIU4_9BURK|nr:M20 aminoacylase family protein [Glaciimonas soli]MQQ99698.1 amidohydrolase [Glaciimonas soli]
MISEIQKELDALTAIRRDIHAHPELGYEEFRTSKIVADKLISWGLEVHCGIAKTGVVGTLKRGTSERSIGLSADMDALPLTEMNTFQHQSNAPGKMHACGHDGHTTMLLGAAQYLAQHGKFDGVVHFIFRPAEEGGGGALKMIEEGVFERFPCDAIFGMHNVPNIPEFAIAGRVGAITASVSTFSILISGKGGHAARPHLTIDPIVVAAQLVMAIQTLVSRFTDPSESTVVSITKIQASGGNTSTIPQDAIIEGTIRTYSNKALARIEECLKAMAQDIPSAFQARGILELRHGYPASICTETETRLALDVAKRLFGMNGVIENIEPTMAGDDFSYMLQVCPGAMLFIGNGDGAHRGEQAGMGPCVVHNPWFDFNDAILPVGASYWAKLAETYLSAN